MTNGTLQHIDESRLENDPGYRFGCLTEFMGFTASDIDAIHPMAPRLAPLGSTRVDWLQNDLIARYYAAPRRCCR